MGVDQRRLQEMLASLAGASKLVDEHLAVYRPAADHLKAQDDFLKTLLGVTENLKVRNLLGLTNSVQNDFVKTLLGVPPRGPLFDALTGVPDSSQLRNVFGAVDPLNRDVTRALGVYKDLYSVLGAPDDTLRRFNSLFGTSLAEATVEFERLRPLLERYERSIAEKEDESTGRSRLAQLILDIIQGGIEGRIGFNLKFQTPRERACAVVAIICLLWRIATWSQERAETEQIRIERLVTARQMGAVAEALRDLEKEVAQEHEEQIPNGPSLRLIRKGILRDGPSSTAARVSTFPVGTDLELIVAMNRWYYVEVIARGSRTGIRGWIYRRTVEHISERQRARTH